MSPRARRLVSVFATLLLGARADAQAPAFRIDDLLTLLPANISSYPTDFATAGGVTYFAANTSATGRELWKSDGTPAGTTLVKDVWPGPSGGLQNTAGLVEMGGAIYFTADDGTGSWHEVWRSDGTAEGTVRLSTIPSSSSPDNLTPVGGTLFFTSSDGGAVAGAELWKTDGSVGGTVLVKDVRPGTAGSNPSWLAAAGGTLFFQADDGAAGRELWKSDGTAAGTVLVKDIRPGAAGSAPTPIRRAGSRVVFGADDGVTGLEPWTSDGTATGTTQLSNISPGGSSFPQFPLEGGDTLFFYAYPGLWQTDGTPSGTAFLTELPGFQGNLFEHGGAAYYTAHDPMSGVELWRSDGTSEGTALLIDAAPGAMDSYPNQLTAVGDLVYFTTVFQGLWSSDGTPEGTVLLRSDLDIGYLHDADDFLLFGANDDSDPHGYELWRSEGAPASTAPVLNLAPDTNYSSDPESFVEVDGTVFFVASSDGTPNDELWTTDGTAAGTSLVLDIRPGTFSSLPALLTRVGSRLFFVADDGTSGRELWTSDGTAGGTHRVRDILPGTGSAHPELLTPIGDVLYFAADDGVTGKELWRSDGTEAGTTLVTELWPGPIGGLGPPLKTMGRFGDRIVFCAEDGVNGRELWISDGTAAGTSLVLDIRPGSANANPALYRESGGVLYFVARTSGEGAELWRSDGTAAGTSLVRNIAPSSVDAGITEIAALGGALYFAADDGTSGLELWTSDGTPGGTVRLGDLRPGALGSAPQKLAVAGGVLVFSADDGTSGRELWRSDGTAAGTSLLEDVRPGAAGSAPGPFLAAHGNVYFTADDGSAGREPWGSDGTGAGTRRIADVAPTIGIAYSSDPGSYATLGDAIVFAATDPDHGREPWAYVAASAADCSNGQDDDADGRIDGLDPGCTGAADLSERAALLPCDDGLDADGDGRADFDPATRADAPAFAAGIGDPGCQDPTWPTESPACQNGLDDDGASGVDFDAGLSVLGSADPAGPDPQCAGKPWRNRETPGSCGLGAEIALLLAAWRRLAHHLPR